MFRWLKGSKNKRKDRSTNDEYGFQDRTTQYGFHPNRSVDALDSSVHIYDEISEVPEISFSRQFTLLPDETNIGKNTEGPYLVVPILPARRHLDSKVGNSDVSGPKSENLQKRVYNKPWDLSTEEVLEHQIDTFVHPAYRDSDSGYTCGSVSNKTDSERISDSDTGCEYDMSTSTGSDVSSEYKDLINKMQNNLALKHQILQMIKETDNENIQQTKAKKNTSTSSIDSAEFTRLHDLPDDGAESDYSSGIDDFETGVDTVSENVEHRNPSCDKYGLHESAHKTGSGQQFRKGDKCLTDKIQNIRALNNSNSKPSKDHEVDLRCTKRDSWKSYVPKQTNIYNNPNSKRGSNRLLGDLINMNHNIQTLKF